jgi:hypothetical protein
MGATCQKLSSEDETITNIFNSLLLKDIPVNQSYEEFQQCMCNDDLDFFKYFNYTNKIIGNNLYQDLQKVFFENLWKEKDRRSQKIGILVVALSKSSDSEKIDYILKHLDCYYLVGKDVNKGKAIEIGVKNMLADMIYMHSTLCYNTFRTHVGNDNMKNYVQIWNDKRKEKLMFTIYQNYESVRYKYHRKKMSDGDVRSRNSSDSNNVQEREQVDYESLVLREFLELIETQLDGDFIREWLHEDFMKEKSGDRICI